MSQENGGSAGNSLWVTGQEQTGLRSGISRVLTTELTAANSSHLQAGHYVAILWQRTGGMQKRRARETAGTALSQGHEAGREAQLE